MPTIIIKNFNGSLKCFDDKTGFEENHLILSTFLLRYGVRIVGLKTLNFKNYYYFFFNKLKLVFIKQNVYLKYINAYKFINVYMCINVFVISVQMYMCIKRVSQKPAWNTRNKSILSKIKTIARLLISWRVKIILNYIIRLLVGAVWPSNGRRRHAVNQYITIKSYTFV